MTDYELHTQAMQSVEYSNHHNKMFHGPGWLNINAMQMCASDKPEDDKLFRPTTLYNVFLLNELDFGKPMCYMKTHLEISDKLDFHPKTFYAIINTPDKVPVLSKKYKIVEAGRTSVNWIINGENYYSNTDAAKVLGAKSANAITASYKNGYYKNRDVIKRYVILDMNDQVLEVL